jgi:hypothetical protein
MYPSITVYYCIHLLFDYCFPVLLDSLIMRLLHYGIDDNVVF